MNQNIINKVCIINCFDTYEHRVDLICNYFKSIGAIVKVITSNYRHIEKCVREDDKENYVFVDTLPYNKNLSVKRLKSHRKLSKKIFRLIENDTFDLLWVLVPPNSFVCDAAKYKAKNGKTKLIFDLIDLWPETMPITKYKSFPPFSWWRMIRDNNLDSADKIVTECDLYHKKIPKKVQTKLHTIYLARELKEFNSSVNVPVDRISLCYLGSINNIIDISGIAKLIRSINSIKPVELHIIGDGEKREEFIKTCETAGATVWYHGKIYNTIDKQKIFDSCHYGLNFMKDSVCVGLTMKSMDYFEGGLPIINNIHGDTWELISKYQIGFNITDLDKVLKYDVSIRKNVREFFEKNFSIECFNKKIEKLLQE